MIKKPFVIGIAGSSGSGKTYFLRNFLNHFSQSEATLISQDDYYFPANTKTKEENKLYNFDIPSSINRDGFFDDIKKLFEGETVFKEEYTFNNSSMKPKTIRLDPAPILLVEGLFIFHYEEINELLDYRIFMDAHEKIALERRLKRDFTERGYDHDDVMYKWINHVIPSFKEFLLPYRESCDLVIHNNSDNPQIIEDYTNQIVEEIKSRIPKK